MKKTTLNGQSADIVTNNIQQLKALFPYVFAEGSIDFDKLKVVLGEYVDDDEERYNFTWWGKSKALRLAQTPSTGTLRPCPEESKDWDSTQNLYIEGDNLEVLKLLQKTYHKKVKMIYIDPPYNTGKDFVYPDDFRDGIKSYKEITGQMDAEGRNISTNSESEGRYHTNWLNMMYPRLRLARNLLHEAGFVFISIDENEIHNLKKVCNEIFGESNFVTTIANTNNPKGRSDDKYVATAHEYILIYKKSEKSQLGGFPPTEKITRRYNKTDNDGRKYRDIDLRKTGDGDKRTDRPNMYFPIFYNQSTGEIKVSENDDDLVGHRKILPIKNDGTDGRWRWQRSTVQENINKLYAKQMPQRGIWGVFEKDYLEDKSFVKPTSSWTFKDVNSERGSEQFIELGFDKEIFPRPKPIGTLKRILQIGTSTNDVVLDFFAGSSSLAQATIEFNAQQNSSLKYILVQLPEPINREEEAYKAGFENIAEIGKERIRRAGDKIKAELSEKYKAQQGQLLVADEDKVMTPDDLDIGFKVFKLDTSNLKKWNPDADNLDTSLFDSIENFVEGRNELDVVYEIMLKYGIDLTLPIEEYPAADKTIYSIGLGALMICLDSEITTDVAQKIVKLKAKLSPEVMRVVFKDNGFKDDSAKTNTKEILRTNGVDEIVSI